jgi:hypothetical protein
MVSKLAITDIAMTDDENSQSVPNTQSSTSHTANMNEPAIQETKTRLRLPERQQKRCCAACA